MAADPLEATELGDRRFDDRLPDESPEGRARDRARLERLLARVAGLPTKGLSLTDRVTHGLLREEIENDLSQASCELDDWVVDAREGPQVVFLRLPELQPVRTVAEGRALAARWQKIGVAIDQESANLRRGLAAGKVSTRAEVARVLGQLDELLATPDAKWPLRAPAAAPHADWPLAERAALAAAVDGAIAQQIRPAFERYRELLRVEIQPRARDDAHAGISNVPGGAACYERLVKIHTSLDLSPQQIQRHRARGAGARASRDEDARPEGPRHGLAARDPTPAAGRSEAHVQDARGDRGLGARATLARATAAEPRFLGRLPRTPCIVKAIDAFEEKDSPIAYYRPAALDGSRPGTYYVDTYKPETHPRHEVEALAFHESIPGHHIQISLAQELDGAARVPREPGGDGVRRRVGSLRRGLGRRARAVLGAARATRTP